MSWFYLLLAGLFEMGWPLGFKLSQQPAQGGSVMVLAVASIALSGYLLWLAQREIPMGTAYAVWTGIGGAGPFLTGVIFLVTPHQWPALLAWP